MACGCGYRKRLRGNREVGRAEKTHYLDNCATTMPDRRSIGAFERSCRSEWANPSSAHAAGLAAGGRLSENRAAIAGAFGCAAEGIAFCSSGSEAIHAGIWGLAARHRNMRFVTAAVEHGAVRAPLRMLAALGRDVRICPVDGNGRMVPERLEELLSGCPDGGCAVVYSPVNHETGNIQDIPAIREIAARRGALILMDAVQTAPRLAAGSWAPYADLFAVSAHKIHAPKGSAFLWAEPALKLRAFRYGGGQERGIFPGTENAPGIAAFAEASRILAASLAEDAALQRVLEKDFFDLCGKRGIPVEKESADDHAPGVFCVSLPWIPDMETFMTGLAAKGICASRFSACTDRVDGPSRVLAAMGRPVARAGTSLRIGLGRFSTREDLTALAAAMETAREERSVSPTTDRES